MQICIDIPDDHIELLLKLFIVAKLEPEKRALLAGNPVFENVTTEVIKAFVEVHGPEIYEQTFRRSGFSEYLHSFIVDQVVELNGPGFNEDRVRRLIRTVIAPIVPTEALAKRIVTDVRKQCVQAGR